MDQWMVHYMGSRNKRTFVTQEILYSWAVVVVKCWAFYSDDPSLNPAEVDSFYSVNCLKRTKINKKRPGWLIFLKIYSYLDKTNILKGDASCTVGRVVTPDPRRHRFESIHMLFICCLPSAPTIRVRIAKKSTIFKNGHSLHLFIFIFVFSNSYIRSL